MLYAYSICAPDCEACLPELFPLAPEIGRLRSRIYECYRTATGLRRSPPNWPDGDRDKKTRKSRTYILRVRLGLAENCLLISWS
jgi:hypothetical protein